VLSVTEGPLRVERMTTFLEPNKTPSGSARHDGPRLEGKRKTARKMGAVSSVGALVSCYRLQRHKHLTCTKQLVPTRFLSIALAELRSRCPSCCHNRLYKLEMHGPNRLLLGRTEKPWV